MRSYDPRKMIPYPVEPTALKRLSWNLRRTALATRNPPVRNQAVLDYFGFMGGQPMPTYLPQRMAFQQWKTDPDSVRRNWFSSTQAYLSMVNNFKGGVPTRVARVLPKPLMYHEALAAKMRGGAVLPPPPNYAPVPVILRRLHAQSDSGLGVEEPPPGAFAHTAEAVTAARHLSRAAQKQRALAEALGAAAHKRGLARF